MAAATENMTGPAKSITSNTAKTAKTRNARESIYRLAATVAAVVAYLCLAQFATAKEPVLAQSVSKSEIIAAKIAELHDHDHLDAHDDVAGHCVTLNGMSILFDPTASDEAVAEQLEQLPDEQFAAFLPQGSRWTSTATDGAVAQGQSITITYSFVPDGTLIAVTGFSGSEPSNLFANFDANFPGGRAAWKAKFAEAFNRWGELLNVTYVEVADDGAAFPSSPGLLAGPGVVGRGDVRIAMRTLGDALAVNFFPQFGGDMVMDSLDMATFINSANNFRSLRNVLAHEHGHGIGLNHVLPSNGTKLMEPFLSTNYDGPQEDDIRGAQFIYGDWAEQNDLLTTSTFVGGPLNDPASVGAQVITISDVSIERSGVSDFYSFTAFAGVPIAIRVDPVGTTYEFGAQGTSATTSVNAKSVRNLGLRLWRRVSAANNTFSLLAQIDFNAAGQSEYHPPISYTLAGFMVVEVFSNDGINDCQRYQLTISNTDIAAPVESPAMSVFNIAAGQQLFDGSTVQFGQSNIGSAVNQTLTISNAGPGALQIGQVSLAGPGAADYSFNLIGNSVAAGGTGSMVISFNPSAAGVRQAVLTLPSNDPLQPNFSVILSGTGVTPIAPAISVSIENINVSHNDAVNLGDVEVGASLTLSMRIQNTGNAQLNVNSVSFFGNLAVDISTNLTDSSLAPGGSVSFSLFVQPSAEGQRTTKMRIFSNAVPSPFLLDLFANGVVQDEPITDCNGNGIDDADDITLGVSDDCDGNGIPDECEADSDGDGVIDVCDVCNGLDDTIDLNGNGIPDCTEQVDADADDEDNFNEDENDGDEDDNNQQIGGGLCGTGSGLSFMMAMLLCGGMSRRRMCRIRRTM